MKKLYSLDIAKSYQLHRRHRFAAGGMGVASANVEPLGLYQLVRMPGSHEAMLTNPSGLAEKILEAGRD